VHLKFNQINVMIGTVVYARWKADGNFYPGTVLAHGVTGVTIHYFDSATTVVRLGIVSNYQCMIK